MDPYTAHRQTDRIQKNIQHNINFWILLY